MKSLALAFVLIVGAMVPLLARQSPMIDRAARLPPVNAQERARQEEIAVGVTNLAMLTGSSVALLEPVPVAKVEPEYPEIARAAGISAIVAVQVEVNTSGAVVSAKVLRSSPFLDQAALDAVRRWQFAPITINGAPVAYTAVVPVRFGRSRP